MKTRIVSIKKGAVTQKPPIRRNKRANKLVVSQTNNYVFASALMDAVHEPILILDRDLTVQAANSALFRIFKITPAEIMQKNLNDFIPRNPQMQRLIKRLDKLNTPKTLFKEFELKYNFQKIGERIMLINARHIIFDKEQSDFTLLTLEDITKRRIIEQQKDDFVGYVTHELKTPVDFSDGIYPNTARLSRKNAR